MFIDDRGDAGRAFRAAVRDAEECAACGRLSVDGVFTLSDRFGRVVKEVRVEARR